MSTKELEKLIGLDQIKPIQVSAGDETVIRAEGDVFSEWYREELIKLIREDKR